MEQVGGSLLPLQQRSGYTPEMVDEVSRRRTASQKCVWAPPPRPHPWEIQKGPEVAMASILRGTAAVFQGCCRIKSSWRNMCGTNIRSLTENSVCPTPILSIQVPRSLQLCLKEVSRQGLLSIGCQEDEIILFCIFSVFLKVGWPLSSYLRLLEHKG